MGMRALRITPLLAGLLLAGIGLARASDEYRLDDGVKESGIGLHPASDYSIAWLNRFVIQPGHETIHSVNVVFGGGIASTNIPNGSPVTVFILYDTQQDGVPDHDVLLAQASGVVANSGNNAFNRYALTSPLPLQAGDVIFAGAIVTYSGEPSVASIDRDGTDDATPYPPNDHSFLASNWRAPIAAVDPTHLAWADTPVATVRTALYGGTGDGNWMIRLDASAPGAPLPVLTPTAFDFGDIDIGSTATTQVNLRNAGTATWHILLHVLTPPSSPFQVLDGTCGPVPRQLVPGQACDLDVVFAPTRHGVHALTVELAGNTPPGSAMFTVKGRGTLFADGFD